MDIRNAKVGDRFIRRDGSEVIVIRNDGSDMPVLAKDGNGKQWWHFPNGCVYGGLEAEQDIVRAFEKPVVTVEAGKTYVTKDGRKAHIFGKQPFDTKPDELPWCGVVEGKTISELFWWDDHGTPGSGVPDTRLVSEWVEPKRIKGWVNVNSHQSVGDDAIADLGGGVWPSKELADSVAREDRIACIEIDVLEGHGLNGEAGR